MTPPPRRASRAAAMTMIACLGVAMAGEREASPDTTDRVLAGLAAEDASTRSRAAATLEAVVVDGAGLDLVLERFGALPLEARARVRETILGLPATGAGLVRRARAGDDVAAALLPDLLLHEIARRLDRDHLTEGPLERGAFESGVVVGLDWPIGVPLPLDAAVRALGAAVLGAKPLALSPAIGDRAPVTPLEMSPTTASALLHRWLSARDLAVVDAGLVFLIVDAEVAAARERSLEPREVVAESDDEERDRVAPRSAPAPWRADTWAARHLAELLCQDDSASGARATLLAAMSLGPFGADLPSLDHRHPTGALARWLGGGTDPALRRMILLALRDRGAALEPLVSTLLRDPDPERRLAGAWLAATGRVAGACDRLRSLLDDEDRSVAVAAALARVRLLPHEPGVGRELAVALGDGVPIGLLGAALEAAEQLALSGEAGGAGVGAGLLAASDPAARAVGAVLLACDPAAGPRSARLLAGAPPVVHAAFAVGLARRGGAIPTVDRLLVRSDDVGAATAWLLSLRADDEWLGRDFVVAAEFAGARGDRVMLRALTTLCAADMLRDEEYRPGRLRTALRGFRAVPATQRVVDELWKALTEEDRGADVRSLGLDELPWTAR